MLVRIAKQRKLRRGMRAISEQRPRQHKEKAARDVNGSDHPNQHKRFGPESRHVKRCPRNPRGGDPVDQEARPHDESRVEADKSDRAQGGESES